MFWPSRLEKELNISDWNCVWFFDSRGVTQLYVLKKNFTFSNRTDFDNSNSRGRTMTRIKGGTPTIFKKIRSLGVKEGVRSPLCNAAFSRIRCQSDGRTTIFVQSAVVTRRKWTRSCPSANLANTSRDLTTTGSRGSNNAWGRGLVSGAEISPSAINLGARHSRSCLIPLWMAGLRISEARWWWWRGMRSSLRLVVWHDELVLKWDTKYHARFWIH